MRTCSCPSCGNTITRKRILTGLLALPPAPAIACGMCGAPLSTMAPIRHGLIAGLVVMTILFTVGHDVPRSVLAALAAILTTPILSVALAPASALTGPWSWTSDRWQTTADRFILRWMLERGSALAVSRGVRATDRPLIAAWIRQRRTALGVPEEPTT